ncbi:hypothetical protein COI51_12755 [Bacillus toyonensis]|uniref:hypothetical protein n=1 Tax=Bacillus toyonensis TaxID=155322 RepID=UPI000BF1AE02|nr:hypothetical protein [Bacillus toyonensis]PEM15268.1 hypothetical protein CN616_23225 [Bacillus toyonensis]PGB24854.1 hypothetical protein COM06_19630 [Bacillus toyonensis]PGC34659.1 hypothetical protein COM10_20330 [Bacillus toyonensis]PHF84372.1 hypothetical protein COI51_12755 [Bacillus toyonensis]PHF99857.1 hypothetical protein COI49_23380 [Bacillus toyonensis]
MEMSEKKVLGLTSAAILGTLGVGFQAIATLGVSEVVATNLYYALNVIGWGATAAAIVSSAGLGAVAAQAIWAAVKKKTIQQFVKW